MKKRILLWVVLLAISPMAFSIKYICKQKCFQYCKIRQQAVKDCKILQPTSVSFRIQCECRLLKQGEILPAYFHHSRIIKTSAM